MKRTVVVCALLSALALPSCYSRRNSDQSDLETAALVESMRKENESDPRYEAALRDINDAAAEEPHVATPAELAELIRRERLERANPAPYLVVSGDDAAAFGSEVSEYLRKGYELRGPMLTERESGKPGAALRYIQNLTHPSKTKR